MNWNLIKNNKYTLIDISGRYVLAGIKVIRLGWIQDNKI